MHLRRFFMMIIAALGVASCSDSEPAQTTAACPDVGAASDATSGDDTIDPGADAQLDAEGTDTASSDTDNGRFTCGPVLERIVPAPGYIRDGLGVHSYRYSLDFTEEITVLTLLDGEGEAVGEFTIVLIEPDDGSAGYFEVLFNQQGQNALRLTHQLIEADTSFTARNTLEHMGKEVELWATADQDGEPQSISVVAPTDLTPTDGYIRRAGDERHSVLNFSLEEEVTDEEARARFERWIEELDLAAVAQSEALDYLIVLGNTAWLRTAFAHILECENGAEKDGCSENKADDPCAPTRFYNLLDAVKGKYEVLIAVVNPGPGAARTGVRFAISKINMMGPPLTLLQQIADSRPWTDVNPCNESDGSGGFSCAAACNRQGRETSDPQGACQSRDNNVQCICGDGGCLFGCIKGDPHFVSIDGKSFDYQGGGEYVIAESTAGEPLVIQGRTEPFSFASDLCPGVSVLTAVATIYAGHRVAFYLGGEVWIDGVQVENPEHGLGDLVGGQLITSQQNSTLVWPDGTYLSVRYNGRSLSLDVKFPDLRRGQIRGLLGSFDGDQSNDLQMRGDRTFRGSHSNDVGRVADSWRIQPRESLFDYAQGESTETFQLYGFPDPATTIDDLPPEVRHAALVQCLEARLTDKFALDSCVLDRACEVVGMEEDGDFEMGPVAEGVSEDIGIEPSAGLRMVGIPSSVLLDTFEDSHAIRAFREVESFPVFHDISVDVSAPGAVQRPEDFSPSVIPAGTSIDSYLIHMDPERTATRAVLGRLTFPRPIVGVIVTSTNLNQSADVLNAPGTVYPERASRGLELDGDDLFEIDPDGHSMTIQLHARDDFDQIRVLVEGGAL